MKKDLLIAGGCSFTVKNFETYDTTVPKNERGPWTMWPEHLANHLSLDCINVGEGGAGADYIFNSVFEAICKNKGRVHTVAILWSDCSRSEMYHSYFTNIIAELADQRKFSHWERPDGKKFEMKGWMEKLGVGDLALKFFKQMPFPYSMYRNMVNNQMSKIAAMISICDLLDIKLVMLQGVHFIGNEYLDDFIDRGIVPEYVRLPNSTLAKYILNSPYFEQIKNSKTFIGFPFTKMLGGYSIDELRSNGDGTLKYAVSETDNHPTAQGQEFIASVFMEKLNG